MSFEKNTHQTWQARFSPVTPQSLLYSQVSVVGDTVNNSGQSNCTPVKVCRVVNPSVFYCVQYGALQLYRAGKAGSREM